MGGELDRLIYWLRLLIDYHLVGEGRGSFSENLCRYVKSYSFADGDTTLSIYVLILDSSVEGH